MPLYAYQCTECGDHFDKQQKIVDRDTAECPQCKGLGAQQITTTLIKLDDSFPGQNLKWGRERKKHNKLLNPSGE